MQRQNNPAGAEEGGSPLAVGPLAARQTTPIVAGSEEEAGFLDSFFKALTTLAYDDGQDGGYVAAQDGRRRLPVEAIPLFGEFGYYEYPDNDGDMFDGGGKEDISDLFYGMMSVTGHTTCASYVMVDHAVSEARNLGSAVVSIATGSSSGSSLPRQPKSPDEPRKVAIVYFDTGGGHRSAAQSLDGALKRLYGSRVEVETVEVSKLVPPPWSYASEIYTWLGQHPAIYEKVWNQDAQANDFRNTRLYSNMRWNSVNHVTAWCTEALQRGVDVILSVHPFCNHLTGDALEYIRKAYGDPNLGIQATVVTDLGAAHLAWFDPRCEAVFVPNEEMRQRARDLQVEDSTIIVHGLPVRPGFWEPVLEPKQVWRERLGILDHTDTPPASTQHTSVLEAEEPLVALLMGGGEGFGELQATAIAVGERLAKEAVNGLDSRLIVACGRNEATRQALIDHPWPEGHPPPLVLGFTSNIEEYMSASDVFLTKAGPGSIAEACIRGLPCLLTSFLPGQEEPNITWVTDAGAGDYISDEDPPAIAELLVTWFRDRELLQRMSACALELARPAATLDIARSIGERLLKLSDDGGSSSSAMAMPPDSSCGCGEGLKRLVVPPPPSATRSGTKEAPDEAGQ